MTQKEDYESRTEQLILPILNEKQFELVDVEYVKEAGDWYLRAYIDKPGGITIDDCEAVSRKLSDLLDEAMPTFLKSARRGLQDRLRKTAIMTGTSESL